MRIQPSRRLDEQAPKVWRIAAMLHSALVWCVAITIAIVQIVFDLPWYITAFFILFALLHTIFFVIIYPRLRCLRWKYEIYDHEIELMKGVFFVERTVIPMVRIQHVDTIQGPLLRQYGLASVTFSTAAGSHEIPALSLETADGVRETIAGLARVSREDV